MLKFNAVGEYSDEEMYGSDFHKDEIRKNVEDRLIINVVGNLHVVGQFSLSVLVMFATVFSII